MAKRNVGRPPIPEDEVAVLKETYLSLLRLGKTEIEISAVEGMVCWETRYRWLSDAEFSARRIEAQGQGVELALIAHDERMAKVYDMALDDAANKPLVDIVKEMGQHARWRASKLNRKIYGDKLSTELTGKDGKPIETTATVQVYVPENGR